MSFSYLRSALLTAALTVTLSAAAQTPATPTPSVAPNAGTATPLLPSAQVKGAYKDYLRQRYARDREALAIVHLFQRKQRGGLIWMGVMGGLMGFAAANSGTTTNPDGSVSTFTVTPLGWFVQAGLFFGVGLRKEIRFSNGVLYQTLTSHDNRQPVPGYVENKLREKDYQ